MASGSLSHGQRLPRDARPAATQPSEEKPLGQQSRAPRERQPLPQVGSFTQRRRKFRDAAASLRGDVPLGFPKLRQRQRVYILAIFRQDPDGTGRSAEELKRAVPHDEG